MGANVFYCSAFGSTAKDAFASAVQQAKYDYGHAGYTGTIAEKHSFKMITEEEFASANDAMNYADKLIDDGDPRVDNKWGPAGCVKYRTKEGTIKFLFFGWASS